MSGPATLGFLRTEGLRKSFGEVHAVDGVDLGFQEGVLTAIIGPNGAGKTTFVNLLSGSIAPDTGRIVFQEEDITHLPVHERVRRGLGRSFQITSIFPQLTVRQNVQIPLLGSLRSGWRFWRRLESMTELARRSDRLLADIGLQDEEKVPAGYLSHGDQRLLEIGVALAAGPRLLLLDEPTAGMNPAERRRVLELIAGLHAARRTTFVIIEHDMDVVFALAEEVVVLHQGRLLAKGKPDVIRENPQVREVYLGVELA
ncbi:MAG: ABC transporter ATP-binding protein [Nitrospinota bacterium]